MSQLANARTWVCDHAGFYDTFQIGDVVAWLTGEEGFPAQAVRDAIRGLVRAGVLVRQGPGVYAWAPPRG